MATTSATLQRLAVAWSVPDSPLIIEDLVKASGILQTALVANASHGNKHKYKLLNAIPSGAFRNIGEGIVPTSLSTDRAQIDLWNLSILIQEDWKEFENYPGGKAGWLADNYGAYLEGMGQTASKQLYYGTDPTFGSTKGFVGLHQYAKAYSNVQQLSGTTASRSTIFAVRWDAQNGASIRKNGTMNLIQTLDLTPTSPATVTTNTTTGAQLPVYQWVVDAFLTLVVPGAKSVSAITQIDSTHKPTALQINNMINDIYSATGDKKIYCNPNTANYIHDLKNDKLSMFSTDRDYDNAVFSWRGIDVVLDENLLSTETTVLD